MIKVTGVSKTYGHTVALSDVNIEVSRGECVALTGANGSGRTTLLRILATLIRPACGTLKIDGIDAVKHVYKVRPRLAYVGEESISHRTFASTLRVEEYLQFMHSTRRSVAGDADDAVRTALARAGLTGSTPLCALSTGSRQRLLLSTVLAFRFDVLLLDDPLRSLDAEARAGFLEWLQHARDTGSTIVVALNDDRDLAALCHRSAQLDAGRISTLTSAARSREVISQRASPVVATSPV
jgi:ABC-type multidrug transport system ATPase subunit